MKKYILTGLVILCPIAITLWLLNWLFDFLTAPFMGMIQDLMSHFGLVAGLHPALVFAARLFVLLALFIFILALGFAGQQLFLNWIVSSMQKLFLRIPVVKTIYKLTTEIVNPLLSPGAKPFKKAVAMKFPTENSVAIALLTGDAPKAIKSEGPLKTVFLPTAPHPISGFVLITAEENLKDIDISVEDVFKILISCGSYDPNDDKTPS